MVRYNRPGLYTLFRTCDSHVFEIRTSFCHDRYCFSNDGVSTQDWLFDSAIPERDTIGMSQYIISIFLLTIWCQYVVYYIRTKTTDNENIFNQQSGGPSIVEGRPPVTTQMYEVCCCILLIVSIVLLIFETFQFFVSHRCCFRYHMVVSFVGLKHF